MALTDQAKMILRIAQSHWFAREIQRHPAIAWASENRYTLNRIGLAQHYELETGYIDLSHDFDVAAFFATCRFQDGMWQPESEGVGVVYIFDLAKSQRCSFKAEPVSLQPLPRPSEQKAWLVEVPLGQDFESHPAVSWINFKQEEEVSRHFLELFDGGERLFPDEPLARVASRVRQAPQIDEGIVDHIIDQLQGIDISIGASETLKEAISTLIALGSPQESFMEQEDLDALEAEWEARVAEFGKNVTTRPIALRILGAGE